MKKNLLKTTLALTLLAGTAGFLTGCKAPANYKQADKTGAGIADFRAEVTNVKRDVDGALKALDQIAITANTDPRAAFERYSKHVKSLEESAVKARKRGKDIREKGQAYFTEWEQQLAQLKNEEVRQLAEKRKAKLRDTFDSIRQVAEPLNTKFDAWMSDLKDLQTYLGNDLTVAGVDAAKTLFAKTQAEGKDVQKSLDTLISELNTIAAALTPAKVVEPAAGTQPAAK
jgi:predicted  nucleic acid-binding Zn-ribbon protein